MFFLGHMVWAYIFSKHLTKNSLNIPLIMLLGVLPDVDILLKDSIEHRSITHSIPFITLLFLPFLFKYRLKALPYYIATTQHVFFGDLIVGKTQLFWPFGPTIGLGFPLPAIENIIIESLGLGIFITLIIKDRHKLFIRNKINVLIVIPLILLIVLPITYTKYKLDHNSVDNFANNIVKADTALLVSILHILLAMLLVLLLVDGIKGYFIKQNNFSKYG